MPLYEFKKLNAYDHMRIESWDVIKKPRKTLNTNSWDKMVRTVDNAIQSISPSVSSKLIWTKCAALFGTKSQQPLEAVDHLWRMAEKTFGRSEFSLMFVGAFLMWRISFISRPQREGGTGDQWFTVQVDHPSGEVDPITNKPLTERHYWVNNNYSVPREYDALDLVLKFNKCRR